MEKWLQKVLEITNGIVWGPVMLALLLGTGLFISYKINFLQFTRFRLVLKNTLGSVFSKKQYSDEFSGVSSFQAVTTALAATIGTGSITGLATAITLGGPGSVFWMWICALFGMATKYAEILLSHKYREKNSCGKWVGGPMYYIKNGIGSKALAVIFCLLAMVACMGTGNAAQSNSISLAMQNSFGIDRMLSGIITVVIVAVVILGGVKRIAAVNEMLVPFMAVFYIVCALVALVINADKIPSAFALILREAFNFRAALGGSSGFGITVAMRYGISRGIFSNEAGLGTAPIAHAAAITKHGAKQGLLGVFEVFFATIIICTLSALVLLTSGLWNTGEYEGIALIGEAFNRSLCSFGNIAVTLSTVFFALSSILGWAYYGEVCVDFISKKKNAIFIYRIFYVAVTFIGAISSLDLIWNISEIMNGLMALPNLIAIISLSGVVAKETKKFLETEKRK